MPTFEVFRTFEKTRIHFKSDVFAAVAHPCGPVTGPGVPWGSSSDKLIASPVLSEKFCHFNIPTWRQAGLRSRHLRRLKMRIPTTVFRWHGKMAFKSHFHFSFSHNIQKQISNCA